jgi:ribosomal protein S18 acetylase RimI-like enzyme
MYSIERVRPEQAQQLSDIAFASKGYWGYPKRWMDLWKPQLTFSPEFFEQYESWAAVEDARLLGFYTLEQRSGNAWLENLWVLPEFMGKGVGKALFLHAIELSRRRGYKTLQLEADPNAVGFYEKMGMYKLRERQYEIDGQPRILPTMELKL